nr:MAG: putative RNA-dependent RNA polymerase [Narnaviridae sp.]
MIDSRLRDPLALGAHFWAPSGGTSLQGDMNRVPSTSPEYYYCSKRVCRTRRNRTMRFTPLHDKSWFDKQRAGTGKRVRFKFESHTESYKGITSVFDENLTLQPEPNQQPDQPLDPRVLKGLQEIKAREARSVLNKEILADVAETMVSDQAAEPLQLLIDSFSLFFKLDKTKFEERAMKNLRALVGEGKLKSHLKYALAQPMAELTRNTLYEPVKPPADLPDGNTMENGQVRLYILDLFGLESGRQRFRVLTRLTERKNDVPTSRAMTLCFSVLSLKNLAPALTFPELATAVREHQETLTSHMNPTLTDRQKYCLEEIVETLMPEMYYRFEDMPRAKLTDRANLLEEGEPEKELNSARKVVSTRKLRSGLGLKGLVSTPTTGNKTDLKTFINPTQLHSMDDRKVVTSLRQNMPRYEEESYMMDPILQREATLENSAHIVALLEPLKVRTISIDSGPLRYLGSRIQKFLWKKLADCKAFTLIRGTFVEDAIDGLFRRGMSFVSGDYKAATDSIYSNVTDHVVRHIFKKIAFPSDLQNHAEAMARSVTQVILDYQHTLDGEGVRYLLELEKRMARKRGDNYIPLTEKYDYSYGGKITEETDFFWIYDDFKRFHGVDPWLDIIEQKQVKQSRGQLMGNILSFPVLCIINAAAYCHSSLDFLEKEVSSGRAREYSQGLEGLQGTPEEIQELKENYNQFQLLRAFCIPDISESLEQKLQANRYYQEGEMDDHGNPFFLTHIKPSGTGPTDLDSLLEVRIRKAAKIRFKLDFRTNPDDFRDKMFNLPILVNGDDILFQSSRRFYIAWSGTIGLYGLQKSVGKNYFSPHFFTVNSQLFISDSKGFFLDASNGTHILHGDSDQPRFVRTIWWSGLSPSFLQKRKDLFNFTGQKDAFYQDTRSFLPTVQKEFLDSLHNQKNRSLWNDLWLKSNEDFISAFDIPKGYVWSLDPKMENLGPDPGFKVSRTLPVLLGGMGLELNETEKLTPAQKIIACRLNSEQGQAVSTKLADKPFVVELLGRLRPIIEQRYTVIEAFPEEIIFDRPSGEYHFYPRDRESTKFGLQVVPIVDMALKLAPDLFPLWRLPPPDDIKFAGERLKLVTFKVRKWALALNKTAREKFSSLKDTDPTLRRIPSKFVVIKKSRQLVTLTDDDVEERHQKLTREKFHGELTSNEVDISAYDEDFL